MKNTKTILFLTIGVLVVGLATFYKYSRSQETLKPKVGDVIESIYGLGTVTADQIYHLRSGVTLSVGQLFVKEGDLVRSRDPLVKMDESVMRSPMEGTVTSVTYNVGEIVTPHAVIMTITNLKSLYLEVSLEQQSVLRVKKDQRVYVSFESLRNEKFEGVVFSIYPRDNQFIVRIELKNWPMGVLPGMTADVAILVGTKKNVLLIPVRSIIAGQVTRLRSSKKERVPVKLGVIDGEWGEITSENIALDDELLIRK